MIKRLDGVLDGKRRDSFAGAEVRKHDELEAERILNDSLTVFGLCESDLENLKKSDSRKKVIAWLIRKRTCVKNEWISTRLRMGCVTKLSSFVKEVEETKDRKLKTLKNRVKR